jgi:hypothetical protein
MEALLPYVAPPHLDTVRGGVSPWVPMCPRVSPCVPMGPHVSPCVPMGARVGNQMPMQPNRQALRRLRKVTNET